MQLGKYDNLKWIGAGRFGDVYRAEDRSLERPVAIKILKPEWAGDPLFIQQFRDEAKKVAKVEHPNVVGVYEVSEADGRWFMAMQYMPGGSLRQRMDARAEAGGMTLDEALAIALEAAQGLAALHKRGLVHCDLKPANILFDADGHARVSDLGLALSLNSSRGSLTTAAAEARHSPGTPAYMSPEQESGTPHLRPPSDIYALGLILFEMLAELSFKNLPPGTRLAELRPDVPAWLDEVLARMLAKDWEQRMFNGEQAAQALRAGLDGAAAGQKARAESEAAAAEAARRAAQEQSARSAAESAEGERRRAEAAQAARLAAEEQARRAAERKAAAEAEARREVEDRANSQARREAEAQLAGQQKARRKGGISAVVWIGFLGMAALVIFGLAAVLTRQPAATPFPTTAPTALLKTATEPFEGTPPACTAIGQEWTSPVDGMVMVCVPAGIFQMGVTDSVYLDERPQHTVTLNTYWIDKTEVTNAMYRKCVEANRCAAPQFDNSNTRTSYYNNSTFDNFPVIYVTWTDADYYCKWADRSLPSEAEWEYAARGTDGRLYPWGNNAPGSSLANFSSSDTTEAGAYPQGASAFGAVDMAGNVGEWVADWYGPYPSGSVVNPAGPTNGTYVVVRGGSWDLDSRFLRASYRNSFFYGSRQNFLGFRCSR